MPALYSSIERTAHEAVLRFGRPSSARAKELQKMAAFIAKRLNQGDVPKLVFTCTHNSRRSQFCQVWAAALAYRLLNGRSVACFSAGTEATSCNPRTVAALERNGFQVERISQSENPSYRVRFSDEAAPETCFSKMLGSSDVPNEDFLAAMACDTAAEACPVVHGAAVRVPLPFEDPKNADNTAEEHAAYEACSLHIASELTYMFNLISK